MAKNNGNQRAQAGGPRTDLHPQFSSDGASPTPWPEARNLLEQASIYWLATVRPEGRPHVTPLFAVWLTDAIYFCTGPTERKAHNLVDNPHCVIITGCNVIEGHDLIIEGDAQKVTDEADLNAVAARYASKYNWRYEIRDGAFYGEGGRAEVYRVAPTTAFSFGKGDTFSQTRYRF
jgi:uncharacterized pyridoxamine 5'-phosphate oxidase family protein